MMRSRSDDLDVKLLLYAIQKTTSFEKTLAQRFFQSPYMEEVHVYTELNQQSAISSLRLNCVSLSLRNILPQWLKMSLKKMTKMKK